MAIKNFKKSLNVCLTVLTLAAAPVYADNVLEECSKELLIAYFPQTFLNETLAKFNVPKDQWSQINEELAAKDKEVIGIVEDKASKISPNPLKDPQQRRTAVKIFRETLLELFTSVMNQHNITDPAQIQSMLDDIQQQKAKRFAQCMEKQRSELNKSPKDSAPVDIKSSN